MLYPDISSAFGETPLVNINKLFPDFTGKVYGKLEFYNPTSSVKDRLAYAMIDEAERSGALLPGGTLIEATSGNTGIALASIAAATGYHIILTMPESMSKERRALLRAFGAELILTPAALGMKGAVTAAEDLAQSRNGLLLKQFENLAGPAIHYQTTGPEIYRDLNGEIDIFVSGVGTGGTITGAGKYLKEKNPNLQVVAVQPSNSPLLTGGNPGPHMIQGIGPNFLPLVLNTDIYDQVVSSSNEDAFTYAKLAAQKLGILAGISSGANLWAVTQLISKPENRNKSIVVILASYGERYLSTPLYDEYLNP